MNSPPAADSTGRRIGVVGAGIIGLAVARRFTELRPDATVTVLEKERDLALHQTGRNSGVVHAGIYYAPGTLKAELCRRGAAQLRAYARRRDLPFEACGKLVVALDETELGRLGELERRARANAVPGLRRLEGDELREVEPHALGIAGLHSPTTAIIDYRAVARAFAADVGRRAARSPTRHGSTRFGPSGRTCESSPAARSASSTTSSSAPGCSPTGSPARPGTARADDRAVPRGVPPARARPGDRSSAASSTRCPTRTTRSSASTSRAASTAASTSARTRCSRSRARATAGVTSACADLVELLRSPGFRALARRHWRMGAHELRGSLSRRAFAAEARRYVAEIDHTDLVPAPAGVRAQALDPDGSLVDDFRISRLGPVTAVRNAPSPGATSSMAIAEHIVARALAD